MPMKVIVAMLLFSVTAFAQTCSSKHQATKAQCEEAPFWGDYDKVYKCVVDKNGCRSIVVDQEATDSAYKRYAEEVVAQDKKKKLWVALNTRLLTDEEFQRVLDTGDDINVFYTVNIGGGGVGGSYSPGEKAEELHNALLFQYKLRWEHDKVFKKEPVKTKPVETLHMGNQWCDPSPKGECHQSVNYSTFTCPDGFALHGDIIQYQNTKITPRWCFLPGVDK